MKDGAYAPSYALLLLFAHRAISMFFKMMGLAFSNFYVLSQDSFLFISDSFFWFALIFFIAGS